MLRFSSLYKNQLLQFQFDQDRGPAWKPAKANVASSLNIVIHNIELKLGDNLTAVQI